MDNDKLNFKIAVSNDQKEALLKAISDLKRENGTSDDDLSYSEDKNESGIKDLYFEPITATAVGIYVLNIAAAGAASWIVAKALDRMFSAGQETQSKPQDPIVVVIRPDGSIERLDPRRVDEVRQALARIESIE